MKSPNRRWTNLPDSLFYAAGHRGQYIFVLPEQDLVAVRVGDNRKDVFDIEGFLSLAIELAK